MRRDQRGWGFFISQKFALWLCIFKCNFIWIFQVNLKIIYFNIKLCDINIFFSFLITRFSTFAKTGGDAFLMGTVSANVSESDLIKIIVSQMFDSPIHQHLGHHNFQHWKITVGYHSNEAFGFQIMLYFMTSSLFSQGIDLLFITENIYL